MDEREYVQRILDAYRTTPGTCGVVRRADRLLAAQLYERGVAIEAVENALILAVGGSPVVVIRAAAEGSSRRKPNAVAVAMNANAELAPHAP